MAKFIEIPKEKVAEFLSAEDMEKYGVIRLYATKTTRSPKGTKKARTYLGTPIDDTPAAESSIKLNFGDVVQYNGEMATVNTVRRLWIEVVKEDGSKVWTKKGNLSTITDQVPA